MNIVFLILFLFSCSKPEVYDDSDYKVVVTDITGFSEILGRPTDNSVTISLLSDVPSDVYWEYGTAPGSYRMKSTAYKVDKDVPVEVNLINLLPDTRYYYRMRYLGKDSTGDFRATPEHSFHTCRSPGSSFVFTVEADEHLYDKKGNKTLYRISLANQAKDNPDFMISLGDIFGDDHQPASITDTEIDFLHKQYRPLLGQICHSIPLYICLGNHEGESSYYLSQSPPENLAVKSTISRKLYYPNPFPDGFYEGNSEVEQYGLGNPENYYSWTWGDALFVVLDVYRYGDAESVKPQGWGWSLGQKQYEWLKKTIEESKARYKMVFAHHIRGQGRGGVTNAKLFEWGGYEQDGMTYSFTSKRPGWEKPVHKLFADNGVDIFFQGHDHLFSHEVLDGVTYQTVPMPSDSTYQIGILANSGAYTSDVEGGAGHLKVSVSPTGINVEFITAVLPADENGTISNGKSAFTYYVR